MVGDAGDMWRLAAEATTLDTNSPYAYLLVGTHFASTSAVAVDREGGGLAGFASAYRLPDDRDVLFVWQIAVRSDWRGCGLGSRLLLHLLSRPGSRGVRHVQATVTPSNSASSRLFQSFARSLGAQWTAAEQYPADLFPGEGHEPEVLHRVGPFSTPTQEVTTTK
ncbi:MAG: diaminobutyrate acetyltransferase [Acidimicrobiales bacterium]